MIVVFCVTDVILSAVITKRTVRAVILRNYKLSALAWGFRIEKLCISIRPVHIHV